MSGVKTVRHGDFTSFSYAYDSTLGKWIYANVLNDIACVSSRVGMVLETKSFNRTYYNMCRKDTSRTDDYYAWSSSTQMDYITYQSQFIVCDTTGKIQRSPMDTTVEVVCEDVRFRVATEKDREDASLEEERKANACGDDEDDIRKGKLDTNTYYFCYHGYLD